MEDIREGLSNKIPTKESLLNKKFLCYKMEEDKTMEENFDFFLKLIDDLANIKVSISDEDQVIQLLSGLPPF